MTNTKKKGQSVVNSSETQNLSSKHPFKKSVAFAILQTGVRNLFHTSGGGSGPQAQLPPARSCKRSAMKKSTSQVQKRRSCSVLLRMKAFKAEAVTASCQDKNGTLALLLRLPCKFSLNSSRRREGEGAKTCA